MTGADAMAGGGMLDCWFWETNIKMRSSEDCMPIIWLCMTWKPLSAIEMNVGGDKWRTRTRYWPSRRETRLTDRAST